MPLDSLAIPKDSARVVALRDTAYKNFSMDPLKGLRYADAALALAQKIHWKKGEVLSYQAYGANLWALMDYHRAIYFYEQAFQLAKQLNDREQMVNCRIQIGTCYTGLKQYEKALVTYTSSLKEATMLNITRSIISCHFSISYCLNHLGRHDESLQHLKLLLSLPAVQENLSQKAVVYESFIGVLVGMKKAEDGLLYADSLLAIGRRLKAINTLVSAYGSRGDILLNLQQYEKAAAMVMKGIRLMGIPENHADKGRLAHLWNSLGDIYRKQWISIKKPLSLLSAKNAYDQAIPLASSIREWQILADAYLGRSETEQALGSFREALIDYKLFEVARDSMTNLERENMLRRTELDDEFVKWQDSLNIVNRLQQEQLNQQQVNSSLKLRQTLYGWIISILVMIAIAGILLFRNRLQQLKMQQVLDMNEQKAALKEAEFQSRMNDLMLNGLKSQMSPHFLFNCLTSITLYIEEKNLEAAVHYLSKFSQLIRYTLDAASHESILLSRELETLKLYLDLESMRFKEKLTYNIEVDSGVDDDWIRIPHMIIQPLVENAIWHGLMHKQKGGRIRINFQQLPDNRLQVIVEDDGIGRQLSARINAGRDPLRTSLGTRLLEERINLINQKFHAQHLIHTEDLFDPEGRACGTRVTLIIPIS